jgi:hypothetical protein
MKTKLIYRIILSLICIPVFAGSFSQKDFSNASAFKSTTQISTSLPVNDKPKESETISVNIKLLKHFNHMFHNASDVKWEQVDDGFVAAFVNDETPTKTFFNKKGQMICTIDFMPQTGLPLYEKNLIANTYPHYTITSVARVRMDNQKIWYVKLAGKTIYVAVSIEDGEMEEKENFLKGN